MTSLRFDIDLPRAYRGLLDPHPYKIFHGGRGAGKSWAFADVLLLKGIQSAERVLCARELQISIADSVHKLLSDRIDYHGLQEIYNVTQTSIKGINGTEFIFKGLKHNAREIKSMEGITKAWLEEAENISDNSWELLIPTVFRRSNSEIWVSFNNRKPTDPTYKRMVLSPPAGALIKRVSHRDNPFFPPALDRERLELQRKDPIAHAHIWEGEFDERNFGGVYSQQIADMKAKGRIVRDLYDPSLDVYSAWDLGYDDSTGLWLWQRVKGEPRLIKYYESRLQPIEHYCAWLLVQEKHFGYRYKKHYMPHDAANKLLAAGGRSIVMQAEAILGRNSIDVIPATSQQNSIEATRKLLQIAYADEEDCHEGLHALMEYHFEWDEDRKTYKSKPNHDWSSHACDALEIVGQVCKAELQSEQPKKPDKLTFNDVFWSDSANKRRFERI